MKSKEIKPETVLRPRVEKARTADWELRKKAQSEYQQRVSTSGRDIGKIPEVVDQDRRDNCSENFRLFCETYMPNSFPLAWSPDHLVVIGKVESAVLRGELLALALPRGSGKTTVCEAATLWATLYAHRSFITIIGADEPLAEQMLDSISVELDTNALLLEDFPEVCFPISKLEGIHHRAPGQLCEGVRTRMQWSAKRIVLPTVIDTLFGENHPTSGSIIDVAGITGRIRGRKHKREDGTQLRPDLVLIDDPQTDDSARSPAQVNQRLRVINGAILGLAGPGKKISGLLTVTVIVPDDMADQLLDQKRHPQWRGERTKLLYSFPTNERLWDQYAAMRLEDFTRDDGVSSATKFYVSNQDAMDLGSKVAWPERKNPTEASALQHAMNLKLQDEVAFQSEYQNDPLPIVETTDTDLTYEKLSKQFNGMSANTTFVDATHLTFGIDCHKDLLYYVGFACSDDITGAIPIYGSWPKQNRMYYTLRDSKKTISSMFPGRTPEEQLQLALGELVKEIANMRICREDGSVIHVEKILIDSGYETAAVYDFCRRSEHASLVLPYKGIGIGAANKPMSEYPNKKGDKSGLGWRVPAKPAGVRTGVRLVLGDPNMWKSKAAIGLCKSVHERGSITLYGKPPSPMHDLFFDHLMGEFKVATNGRGRDVEEWRLKPGKPDNHLLDGLYMAMIGASMCGAGVINPKAFNGGRKAPVSFSEMQKKARDARR